MTAPLEKSVICPTLIGRGPHLAMVERLLNGVERGTGKTLLISGEAGVGKSRLVAEIRGRLVDQRWSLLEGHCFETERSLPYAPILELLRGYGLNRSPAEIFQALGPASAELVSLLPQLSSFVPQPGVRPEPEKHRLFWAIGQFCAYLASAGPLLLLIEDIHWSDEASLELLLYLVRQLQGQPVLLLFTYRSEETGSGLSHFLAQLDRQRLVNEIHLSPLSREQVELMLQTIFEQTRPIRTDFLEAIYTLTEGNPFFIEEVLKAMLMSGEIFYADGLWDRKPLHELHIPRSVQDAVRQRSRGLSAGAKEVMTLAAVAGPQVEFTLLQQLTQWDEETLLRELKALIEAQLMTEKSAEHFAFRHALTRAAIYASLLARERRQIHRTIGETLDHLYSQKGHEARIADLAYHFYQGQVWEKALVYEQQAGERALALYAPHAAIEHFSHAIEAAGYLQPSPPARLYYLRGQAQALLSDFEAARNDYGTALESARSQGEVPVEWQALLALGYLWASRDYGRSGAYFQEALSLAQTLADEQMIARSLNLLGNWQMNQEQQVEALQRHQEALHIFQKLSDQSGIAETLDLLAIASYNRGDLLQGKAYYAEAIPLWRQLGDQQGLVHSLCGLGMAPDFELEVDEAPVLQAVRWAEQGLQTAREIGWRSGETLALICLGLAARVQGAYGQAMAALQQALAIAEEIEHQEWIVDSLRAQGALYLELLALPEAQQQLERALKLAREINSPIWIFQSAATLASVYILQAELVQARRLLDELLTGRTSAETLQQRFIWGARAELALAEGNPAEALRIVERLLISTANLKPGSVVPRLWDLHGRALAMLRRFSEAETILQAGAQAAQAQGRPGRQWRLHGALGQLYLAQGKGERVEQEILAGRTIIERLTTELAGPAENRVELQLLRDNFWHKATTMLPEPSRLSPSQRTKKRFGGLTAREQEVAALIRQGKTNREIAERLIVSERTAEQHVANIMSKLGFNSRAQIAAWAVERGLG